MFSRICSSARYFPRAVQSFSTTASQAFIPEKQPSTCLPEVICLPDNYPYNSSTQPQSRETKRSTIAMSTGIALVLLGSIGVFVNDVKEQLKHPETLYSDSFPNKPVPPLKPALEKVELVKQEARAPLTLPQQVIVAAPQRIQTPAKTSSSIPTGVKVGLAIAGVGVLGLVLTSKM